MIIGAASNLTADLTVAKKNTPIINPCGCCGAERGVYGVSKRDEFVLLNSVSFECCLICFIQGCLKCFGGPFKFERTCP